MQLNGERHSHCVQNYVIFDDVLFKMHALAVSACLADNIERKNVICSHN